MFYYGDSDVEAHVYASWIDDVGHLPGAPAEGIASSLRARVRVDRTTLAIGGDVNTTPTEIAAGQGQYYFLLNSGGNFSAETSPRAQIEIVPESTDSNIRVYPGHLEVHPPNFQDMVISDSANAAGAGRLAVYSLWGPNEALLLARGARAQAGWRVETFTAANPPTTTVDTIDCVIDPDAQDEFSPDLPNFYDIGGVHKRIQFHDRPSNQRQKRLSIEMLSYTPHPSDNKRGSFTFNPIAPVILAPNDKFNVL